MMSSRLAFAGIFAGAIAVFFAGCSEGDSTGGLSGAAGTHAASGAGGSGNAAAGTNGGTGAGNLTGAGNHTGAAGGSGTGYAGATGTANCINRATMPPVAALITDFSDAVDDPGSAGQFKFGGGVATKVQGGTSEFADTTETKPTLAIVGGALSVTGSSKGSYAGVVLYMNGPACIDGSAYTGVQFDLEGNVGTCGLTFGFGFADDLAPSSDSQRGICAATNCYGPSVAVTTTGTVKVPYTAVSGGSPDMAVDRQKLTGVQWQ
ncbi:MAG TPA: hypothetical protein VKJ01_09400, partial [Candidatus Solibacter sp.]|nr:hypothetical protein [Candidatus Solibacter sp.]